MNTPTVLIVCLKYSPVHNILCRALGEPLRPVGFDVRYLLPHSLGWTVPRAQLEHVTFVGSSRNAREVLWDMLAASTWRRLRLYKFLQEMQPAILLFEASHPANDIVASLARSAAPGIKVWLLLHEPYVMEKSKHGRVRSLLIAAQEWGVKRLVSHLDGVLVPSEEAMRQIRTVYPEFKGLVVKTPLLFEDRGEVESTERLYFSFIGHAVPAKGIDTFFEIVQNSADRGREWAFQIATSTDISGHLRALSSTARSRLTVVNKPYLRDEEIDQAVRASWAVLAPYRRVTQSAVVPVAFMHGTPVISTLAGGMPEHVIEGETGYLLSLDAEFSDWEERFHQVQTGFTRLSANCRRFFLDYFDANHGPKFLRPMLDSIGMDN